jgi:hemolysin activation/secretion protein/AraC-like DNA-binding protein
MTQSLLILSEITVSAGMEWRRDASGWTLARVVRGRGYWLGNGSPTEVDTGCGLVIPPGACGLFRASQLGDVTIGYFSWKPELLVGVLSPAERQFFETRKAARSVRVLSASTLPPVLNEKPGSGEVPLVRRLKLLQCIGEIFGPDMPMALDQSGEPQTAAGRFETLMRQLTEVELLDYSPAQLARRCGCSLRHFGRLFFSRFGVSVRAHQTDLKLQKAGLLLSSCDRKVIDVAMESGYRNLGLFNRMFKKHTGMTPSEWRHRSAQPRLFKTARLALMAAIMFFLAPFGAKAADAPASAPAAASTNAVEHFEVKGYNVEGNTVLEPRIIKGILSKYIGQKMSFADIKKGLGELQLAYRERGFITARVGLPKQVFTNSMVRVTVTEATLSDVTIANNKWFSSNNIMRSFPSVRTNALLNSLVFQQELNRANANADRQIYPEVAPGSEPNTTALRLKVKDRMPLHGALEMNNQAPAGTPDLRFNSALRYNNLWQEDHQVGVQYSFSPEEYKDKTPHLAGFIESPLIASYSGFYRMPLRMGNPAPPQYLTSADFGYDEVAKRFRPPSTDGLSPELTVYGSRSASDTSMKLQSDNLNHTDDYMMTHTNASLQMHDAIYNRTVTFNENLGARLSHPLPKMEKVESAISYGLDYKNYEAYSCQERRTWGSLWYTNYDDGIYGPHPLPANTFSSTNTTKSVHYVPVTIGWDGARRDASGTTSFYLSSSANLAFLSSGASQFQTVRQSYLADGKYVTVSGGVTRDQRLSGEWTAQIRANGQWANQPLISNEQFGLGGEGGPRGYRDGQEYGDTGWKLSLEPRSPLIDIGMVDGTLPMRMRFLAFTDYGERYLLATQLTDPLGNRLGDGGKSRVPMWGAGIGVAGTIGDTYVFRTTLGYPLLDAGSVTAGTMRISFMVSAQF